MLLDRQAEVLSSNVPEKRQKKSTSKEKSQNSKTSTGSTTGTSGGPTVSGQSSGLKQVDATDKMIKRWIKVIQKNVPAVDFIDISEEALSSNPSIRQFAP